MRDLISAIILGIVEGITEFIPISSTGHLLLCEKWMGISLDSGFWKLFTVFIQFGAILAVVVYFRTRIVELLRGKPPAFGAGKPRSRRAIWLILLATLPAITAGKLLHEWVDAHMSSTRVVAYATGIGGIAMILIELLAPRPRTEHMEEMTLFQAIIIGLSQVLAIIFPGTSRSAATIMPGMLAGLSRHASAEFSFFLAIPAMAAASGYSLLKHRVGLDPHAVAVLAVGTLVSFLVAWGVIAFFMSFIRRRSFISFGVYRLILAAIVLWVTR